MKNLKKLGVIFTVGSFAALAFSVAACGDDDDDSKGGTPGAAGTTAGMTSSTGGAGSGGMASTTGGAGASTGGAGASTGGSGGSGGAKGGAGGTGGSGGASGGTGGSGGASGGTGGSGGSGGAAPSADCKKWCEGDMGLIKKCMGSNLLNPVVDSVEKCEAHCSVASASGENGLACWIKHTGFITDMASQNPHCGHASGKPTAAAPCNEIAQ